MTPEQARALLAAPDLLEAARPEDLRVGERLRKQWPADLVAAASAQAALRRAAAEKTDAADGLLLTRDGLEQASGQRVARHRAARFAAAASDVVIDLCCGVGFDLKAFADVAHAIGVDRDETHAICAAHNAGAAVAVADVRDVRLPRSAAVFVDPARRRGGIRGGYEPPLQWCFDQHVDRMAVKAAPGLDLALVPGGWEVEFVAEGRALKEACLWSPAWATATRRASVIHDGETVTMTEAAARPVVAVAPPGSYLLDPSPAVTRSGLVAELAAMLGAWQIDPKIAFLAADHPLRSPFGRGLRVEASLPFSLKALAATLRDLDVGPVDLRRRGLAGDVEDIRRRLRTSGSRRAVVMLTRVVNMPWTLVCFDLDPA